MRSDNRSFGLGMVIGVALAAGALLLALLFNSMAPVKAQDPSPTPAAMQPVLSPNSADSLAERHAHIHVGPRLQHHTQRGSGP